MFYSGGVQQLFLKRTENKKCWEGRWMAALPVPSPPHSISLCRASRARITNPACSLISEMLDSLWAEWDSLKSHQSLLPEPSETRHHKRWELICAWKEFMASSEAGQGKLDWEIHCSSSNIRVARCITVPFFVWCRIYDAENPIMYDNLIILLHIQVLSSSNHSKLFDCH